MSFDFPGVSGPNNVINSQFGVNAGLVITVAVWFNNSVADGGGPGRVLWSHGAKGQELMLMHFNGGNKLAYSRRFFGPSTATWETSSGLIPITGWKCVIITHNANLIETNPVMYLYRAGGPIVIPTLVKTSVGVGSPSYDGQIFRLGNVTSPEDLPFNGKIASVTLWRRVLTPSEIRTVIYRGDKFVTTDLILGWDMRITPTPPPNIDDWTPGSNLGIPTGVSFSADNPTRAYRVGPQMVV